MFQSHLHLPFPPRSAIHRWTGFFCVCLASWLLTACGSGRLPMLHTLSMPSQAAGRSSDTHRAQVLITTGEVHLPDGLDRPELQVLSGGDEVVPLPQDQWRGGLPDEIRSAVLAGVLERPEYAQIPAPGAVRYGLPVYALQLSVQRMDMALGQYVDLDATWSLQALAPVSASGEASRALVCRSSWRRVPAGPAVSDAVQAQQTLMRQWGEQIGRTLARLRSGSAATAGRSATDVLCVP